MHEIRFYPESIQPTRESQRIHPNNAWLWFTRVVEIQWPKMNPECNELPTLGLHAAAVHPDYQPSGQLAVEILD
jgi:hypothetical protein